MSVAQVSPWPIQLALVLVEPAGALNVGSVARLCANYTSRLLTIELRLVAPRCDHRGVEARRMAVHGGALLDRARVFDQLAQALADCGPVVATTGRGEGEPLPTRSLQDALAWLTTQPSPEPSVPEPSVAVPPWGLVFGREDRGLSAAELLQAGCLLQLDTGPSYRSLNLSHAVAVVLHGLHQHLQHPRRPREARTALATRAPLEAMLDDAEQLLLEVGFLYPHTAAARMAKLRTLLQRAGLSVDEVALLRGMVRQCRWAAGRGARTP